MPLLGERFPLLCRRSLGPGRVVLSIVPEGKTDLAARPDAADVVIALAALCNPSQYNTRGVDVIESNFIQPRRIADLCARLGKWLIQFSTSEVYGDPHVHPQPELPLGVDQNLRTQVLRPAVDVKAPELERQRCQFLQHLGYALGINAGTVKSRIARARGNLRGLIAVAWR